MSVLGDWIDYLRLPWKVLPDMQADITRLQMTTYRLEMEDMANQADIDALATKLGELKDNLTSADEGIQAEIDALQAANPAVDVSGLQAAVDALSQQVDATTALVPAPADGGDTPPSA